MPILYQHQPDELPQIAIEDENGWWAGAQRSFATVAIAATVLVSVASTRAANQVIAQHQDEIPTAPATPTFDEDYWQNYVRPVPVSIFQRLPLTDSDDIPAGSLYSSPDEDFWINFPVSIQPWIYPQQYAFDIDESGPLHGQPDEDYWQNPVQPTPARIYQSSPYLFDIGEIVPVPVFSPDEDYWNTQPTPLVRSVRQLFQQGGGGSVVITLPFDEDYWQNPVKPVAPFMYQSLPYLYDIGETVPALIFQSPDEDYWQNSVAPQKFTLLPFAPYDSEEIPAGSLYGVPEDDGADLIRPLPPVPYNRLYLHDEAIWVAPPPVVPTIDEDYQFQAPPIRGQVFQSLQYQEEDWVVTQPPAPPDEDYWSNPIRPVSASNRFSIYLPDADDIPTHIAPTGFLTSSGISVQYLITNPPSITATAIDVEVF